MYKINKNRIILFIIGMFVYSITCIYLFTYNKENTFKSEIVTPSQNIGKIFSVDLTQTELIATSGEPKNINIRLDKNISHIKASFRNRDDTIRYRLYYNNNGDVIVKYKKINIELNDPNISYEVLGITKGQLFDIGENIPIDIVFKVKNQETFNIMVFEAIINTEFVKEQYE